MDTFSFYTGPVHALTIKGMTFFTILYSIIAILIYFLSNIEYKSNIINKFFLFIAKHEYAIYIWHLMIYNNLLTNDPINKVIHKYNAYPVTIVTAIVLITICIIIDNLINNIDFNNIFKKNKKS